MVSVERGSTGAANGGVGYDGGHVRLVDRTPALAAARVGTPSEMEPA